MGELSHQDQAAHRWAAKRAWRERQRALPLPEKIRILIQLQRRQRDVNMIRAALGLPAVPMRVWDTKPE